MMRMQDSVAGAVLRGVVAGAIGAWVMDRVTWAMLDREPLGAIRAEKAARPEGWDVSHLLGKRLVELVGKPTVLKQPGAVGMITHYLLSIGPAIAYAAARGRNPDLAADRGMLYGLGIFLLWDELGSLAAGVARPPGKYPWEAHLRGLLGHLALGGATHVALNALETDFGLRPIETHRGA